MFKYLKNLIEYIINSVRGLLPLHRFNWKTGKVELRVLRGDNTYPTLEDIPIMHVTQNVIPQMTYADHLMSRVNPFSMGSMRLNMQGIAQECISRWGSIPLIPLCERIRQELIMYIGSVLPDFDYRQLTVKLSDEGVVTVLVNMSQYLDHHNPHYSFGFNVVPALRDRWRGDFSIEYSTSMANEYYSLSHEFVKSPDFFKSHVHNCSKCGELVTRVNKNVHDDMCENIV